MKKSLAKLFVLIALVTTASAYEETILCWDPGVAQIDDNAIVILGSGAEFHDVERIELEEVNVSIEGEGKRRGNCVAKFYQGIKNYKCSESVFVERVYYSTAFQMTLELETLKSFNSSVLLSGTLSAKRAHDEFDGPVISSMKKQVICKHRAE